VSLITENENPQGDFIHVLGILENWTDSCLVYYTSASTTDTCVNTGVFFIQVLIVNRAKLIIAVV
jgi:hypothetical protein